MYTVTYVISFFFEGETLAFSMTKNLLLRLTVNNTSAVYLNVNAFLK